MSRVFSNCHSSITPPQLPMTTGRDEERKGVNRSSSEKGRKVGDERERTGEMGIGLSTIIITIIIC